MAEEEAKNPIADHGDDASGVEGTQVQGMDAEDESQGIFQKPSRSILKRTRGYSVRISKQKKKTTWGAIIPKNVAFLPPDSHEARYEDELHAGPAFGGSQGSRLHMKISAATPDGKKKEYVSLESDGEATLPKEPPVDLEGGENVALTEVKVEEGGKPLEENLDENEKQVIAKRKLAQAEYEMMKEMATACEEREWDTGAIVQHMFEFHIVMLDLDEDSLEDIARAMVNEVAKQWELSAEQESEALRAVLERERHFPMGLEGAFDLMFGEVSFLPQKMKARFDKSPGSDGDDMDVLFVFARLKNSLNLGAIDGIPIKFVVLMLGGTQGIEDDDQKALSYQMYSDVAVTIDQLMGNEDFHDSAYMATNRDELAQAYDTYVESLVARTLRRKRAVSIAAGHEVLDDDGDPMPLDEEEEEEKFNCLPLGSGLVKDFKRRMPKYLSDITDAWNPKCISSVLFLLFAALTPAVAFGGLMDNLTNGDIGAIEMVSATALCGVVFALTSAQPLVILGGTGPMLVFTGIMYGLCESMGYEFLSLYTITGIWTGLLTIIMSLTNLSSLITVFTRFTDEIFSTLISFIFIYEAVEKLIHPYLLGHLDADRAVLLGLGTVSLAMLLKAGRNGRYLRGKMREFLSDFGLVIAVGVMTGLDMALHDVHTEKLDIPETFSPTNQRASWFIEFWVGVDVVSIFLGLGLACLASILIFLDENITARLVNKRENNLKKGHGYHQDLLVVGILIIVCSLLGFPWLVASTVPSINHCMSLATIEHGFDPNNPSHRVQHVVYVRENRLTGVFIHVIVGLSLLVVDVLKQVPVPVLLGLFLYMGISSLSDNQFWERVKLLFMDPGLFPPTHYVRKVKLKKIHLFTLIQILCLVVLWIIKTSDIGMMFPVVLLMLLGVRWLIGRFFLSEKELGALDAEESMDTEEPEAGSNL